MRTGRTVATILGLALLSAACGSSAGRAGGPTPLTPPTGTGDVVVQITITGGFMPPDAVAGRIPAFTLTGEGLAITEGPQIEIYPAPALPSVLQQRVTERGIQEILRLAREAGLLGRDRSWTGSGTIMDASTTTFTVVADGRAHTVSAYALGEGEQGIDAEERQVRDQLLGFQQAMSDLARILPDGSVGEQIPYEPAAIAIYVRPYTQVEDPALRQRGDRWPLQASLATFGTRIGGGLRCGVVDGADLETLLPRLRAANSLTPWVDDSSAYALTLRPLLPTEVGCHDTTPS